jgi:hypothetical protein
MTNNKEIGTDHFDVARWENEGGAQRPAKNDVAASWFVPPIVIPIALVAATAARIAYVVYS